MNVTEPIVDETTEESDDEAHTVHIVCCATDSDDLNLNQALFGVKITSVAPVDYNVDEDCRRCDILLEADYCPLFGICPDDT